MTREEFKNLTMEILLNEEFFGISGMVRLFDSDNIDNFKVAQYDDDEWTVEASLPLEEFLDKLYNEIFVNPPKHKEGDVVKIRSDLKVNFDDGIVEDMVELAGKTATIEEVDDDGASELYYKIDVDKKIYWWSDKCFE